MRQGVLSKDCLRFAAFLGLYPSLYRLTVAVLRRYRRREVSYSALTLQTATGGPFCSDVTDGNR